MPKTNRCHAKRLPGTLLMICCLLLTAYSAMAANIVISSRNYVYELDHTGRNIHFKDKATGTDYLNRQEISYCASIKRDGKEFNVSAAAMINKDLLKLTFGEAGVTAVIRIKKEKDYVTFEVTEVNGTLESLTFMNIPLRLNGMPDEPFSACVLSLNPYTHVRQLPALQTHLWATCYTRFKLKGAKIALLGVPVKNMLPLIQQVMRATKEIPLSTAGGAWAQTNKEGYGSYIMSFGGLTEQTVDTWIEMCKDLGFNQIDNHGGGFFNFGELKIDPKIYPGGWSDFKKVNNKLNAAGISSIFHTYAYFIDKTSKYITPVMHPDLGYFNAFTLAQPIGKDDSVIVVNESTANVSTTIGFFVRNSVSLRIGGELVEFTGVTTTPPYKFTGCKRGVFNTTVTAHPANEKAYHMKEVYGRFIPDPESALFKEIAKKTADVVNEAEFNGIYLDAVDGGDVLGGGENFWYYPSLFIFEIAKNLKRPVGMEMASMSHFWWHYRSRWQAWDTPFRGYKRFIDIHLAAIKSPNIFLQPKIKSNDFEHGVWQGDTALINKYAPLPNGSLMLPLNLGWWGNQIGESPQTETTFTDDIEYMCCKLLGNNAGTAILGGFDKGTLKSIPLYHKLDSIIRQYEILRHGKYFSDSILALLRQPGKEFQLFKQTDGKWNFKPTVYQPHKVGGLDQPSSTWTINNTFAAQPLKLRIEALMSVKGYDDPESVVIADFPGADKFVKDSAADGVTGSITNSTDGFRSGQSSGSFSATSTGASVRRGSWINMQQKYEPILNIEKNQALGVWVKGDGKGQLLNLRLESPKHLSHGARGDHFIKIDFTGWRYFELVELESSEFSNYIWPNSDFYVYDSYRHNVGFKTIDKLQFWYNNLPKGETVNCLISPVKALPMVAGEIKNPAITIGGTKIVFPVTMKSGMYLEFNSPTDCKLYSAKGELIQDVTIQGRVPVLQSGDNTTSFTCDKTADVNPRLLVTTITQGAPLNK
ncbi:hypothetical protein [Chitinophaga sp. MM2321]|uniref:hypothetical protein n=1 Tax=Chitinophaga sp. MM2321 TaxID=3137178 RepID=UPI0032D593FF